MPAFKIRAEDYPEIFNPQFEGEGFEPLNQRIDYVVRNFIGKKNRRAEDFFLNQMELAIRDFICSYPHFIEHKSYPYNLRSKFNKRKRKKLKVGDYRTFYTHRIRIGMEEKNYNPFYTVTHSMR